MSESYTELHSKIVDQTASVAVIGLGYVGLPLVVKLSKNTKFLIKGLDIDTNKINKLNAGESYVTDVTNGELDVLKMHDVIYTTAYEDIKDCDIFVITVPTPDVDKIYPDMSYVQSAVDSLAYAVTSPSPLIIIESTIYPGATREMLAEFLGVRKQGQLSPKYTMEDNLFFAFSPERVDPGHIAAPGELESAKLVGGLSTKSGDLATLFYNTIYSRVVGCKAEEAEFSKLYENSYRAVNIALVNELSEIATQNGLNMHRIVDLASTKGFGFHAFRPGPGVGGHCIPVDPIYLSYYARQSHLRTRLIDLSLEINESVPNRVVQCIKSIFSQIPVSLYDGEVVLLGMSYKKNINDYRESPSIEILERLISADVKVKVCDPYFKELHLTSNIIPVSPLTKATLQQASLVVLLVDHREFEPEFILENSSRVLDTKGILSANHNVYYL